jgi:archaellum component FlaC
MESFTPSSKTHPLEYIFRLILIGIPITLFVLFFNKIAPIFTDFFENIWKLIGLGLPLVLIALYIIKHPDFIWMSCKNISRWITTKLITIDPLAYMDSYVELLQKKRGNLQTSKENLVAAKANLGLQMDKTQHDADILLKKAKAATQLIPPDKEAASNYASMAQGDLETLAVYKPNFTLLERNIGFLDKLDKNWGYSIDKLKHEIERLRTQYKTMKTTAEAMNQAREFANGDTEAAKNYNIAVTALETSLTHKIAAIEEFEKNVQPIMNDIDIEKKMQENDGMDLLNKYMANPDSIMLPDNFSEPIKLDSKTTLYTNNVQKSQTANEFNL